MKKYKISFCTVCMNRLYHLRKTLPKNIEDNISYGNVEFIVLDYNSKDDLEKWITTEMSSYLKLGIVKYLKTKEPTTFHMSHSKNVVAKHSSGSIICNVDADNYLGKDFAKYINEEFNIDENSYITIKNKSLYRDSAGRIAMHRKDFLSLRGYDENMKGYGFEDYDMCNRLELLGRRPIYVDSLEFLNTIKHDDDERLKNESNNLRITHILIRYINHAVSEIVYLFKNKKYYKGKIIDNKSFMSSSIYNILKEQNHEYSNKLYKNKWIKGSWSQVGDNITLLRPKKSDLCIVISENIKSKKNAEINKGIFYLLTGKEEIRTAIMFFSQINNRIRMDINKKSRILAPNSKTFGQTKIIYKL